MSAELVFGKQWRTATGFGPRPYIVVRGSTSPSDVVTRILLTDPSGGTTIDNDTVANPGTSFQAELDTCDSTLGQPCLIASTEVLEWDGLYQLSLTFASGQIVSVWLPVVGAFDPNHPTINSPVSGQSSSGQPLLAWTDYTTPGFLNGVDSRSTFLWLARRFARGKRVRGGGE
jgi:hypothetical protein